MNFLDDEKNFAPYDSAQTLASLHKFGGQFREMRAVISDFKLRTKKIDAIEVIGMGGSALAAHIVASVYHGQLKKPLTWSNSYSVSGAANRRTLIVLSSYSGTTEEVLAAYSEARKRKLPMAVLASGGELAKRAKRDRVPAIIFTTHSNPSGQPRLGLGYGIFGMLGIAVAAGALAKKDAQFGAWQQAVKLANVRFDAAMPLVKNPAKLLAAGLIGRVPFLVASEHLEGNLHVFQNQLHETAKHYADFDLLSELNHHLMEGLQFPGGLVKKMSFVFFTSKLYGDRIQKRYPLTQSVVQKQGAKTFRIALRGETRIEQAMEMLAFGSFASYYLAMLHRVDPAMIPWVDLFKAKMK